MKSREEELWQYLDGEGDPAAKDALERELSADAALRRELKLRRRLHEELGQMEADQPSLRFTQNLLERLPALYRRIQIKPLIGRAWVRAYVAIFSLSATILFGFGWFVSAGSVIPIQFNLEDYDLGLAASLPLRLAVIVVSLTAAVLLLLWLDRRLKKRYEGQGVGESGSR